MADWRFLRGWSEGEIQRGLVAQRDLPLNFDPGAEKAPEDGWRRHVSETSLTRERPGPPEPGGAFARAWEAITRYEFSDPAIVVGHFDPREPLQGRTMLLELKALGFRFLAGTRVGATRHEESAQETVAGYRYDTLAGHIESGWEWFLLTKSHSTGKVRFRIAAEWRPGDFPNTWSRIGFLLLGKRYQRRWVRRSHQRLRRVIEEGRPVPEPRVRPLPEGAENLKQDEEIA